MIRGLVNRIATEKGFSGNLYLLQTISARGSRVQDRFAEFVQQATSNPGLFDLLIVAHDGNCMGSVEREEELRKKVEKYMKALRGKLIFAIPNPHIERWYLLDKRAFSRSTGIRGEPKVPTYKCRRDIYKEAVRQALAASGIRALLDGAQYGERIATNMNLHAAGKLDAGLKRFVTELGGFFQQLGEMNS
jgi:hypothetical protein